MAINYTIDDEDEEELIFREDRYVSLRRIHLRENQYVPIHLIGDAMYHHFPNESSVLHEYDHVTKLIRVKIGDFLGPNKVINWEYNRAPDYVRIPEIAKTIYETKHNPIRTIFYTNYNFKTDKFEIIDGSHRFKALELLLSLSNNNGRIIDPKMRNENNEDVAMWFDNSDISWLLNDCIILYVCFQSSLNELISLRNTINLSQPMTYEIPPDPFNEKYQIINVIADDYQLKYRKNFSKSTGENYLKANGMTTRNKFIELLVVLYDKHAVNVNRAGILQQQLRAANNKIHEKILRNELKISEKTKNRCDDSGCYLFIYKNSFLEDFI